PLLLACGMLLAGFSIKSGLVPFHAWLPDSHPAPAPVSAMLSGVLIKTLGVYAIMRVAYGILGFSPGLSRVLMGLGALSMVAGVFLALGQWDFKRLCAFSSVSQVGYIVLGLGLGTPLGITGALLHLFNHSVFKSLLYLDAGAIDYATGKRDLREMGGLRERMPFTAATSLIASLSISGVPPFNGFWSKFLIILACVGSGHYWYGCAAALVSLLTLASFMKVQRYAFDGVLNMRWAAVREVPWRMRVPMALLAAICLAGGLMLLPPVSGCLRAAAGAILPGAGEARLLTGRVAGPGDPAGRR
ncbi:MAG: proton-conducting transporter membrane subunit, partial [Candidatus Aureabacteria bacterium]|nr:proton-conducting transporter membrane subunit [Candidatus Auribacterota bacterium]